MTYDQIDARKEYVRRAREAFHEQEDDWGRESTAQEETVLSRTLALRIVLGILLFLLFVLADITDYKVLDCSTTTIAAEIEKDDYTNAEKYVMMLFADK